MARHCPECGDPLSTSGICGSCGHGRNKAARNDPIKDPDWWRCSNESHGQRCARPGAISHSTHGGGPWYCAAHAFPAAGAMTMPANGFYPLRAILRRVVDPYEALEREAIQSEGAA